MQRAGLQLHEEVSQTKMLFGDAKDFAIECHHDPIPNDGRRVFGRMCIWVAGAAFGDLSEPACMLDVTAEHLRKTLQNLEQQADSDVVRLEDESAFDFLDRKLYRDDDRSNDEVAADAERFFRFDFLTNGGESFDRTKSFAIRSGDHVRILFMDYSSSGQSFHAGRVKHQLIKDRVQEFVSW